jgi:hypothetical protein
MELEIWKVVLNSGVGGIVAVALFQAFQYYLKRQDDREAKLDAKHTAEKTALINQYEKRISDLLAQHSEERKELYQKKQFLMEQLLERVDNKTYQMIDILKGWRNDTSKSKQLESLLEIQTKLDNILPKKADE